MSIDRYFSIFDPKHLDEKRKILIDFYKDMESGLDYLHNKSNYIHNDITLGNVVIQESIADPEFQLIDFGLAKQIANNNSVWPRNNVGTPIYFDDTVHLQYISILYDWHCVLLCVLYMMNIVTSHSLITLHTGERIYDIDETTFSARIANDFVQMIKIE